jgi:hypothetical protein|tara:strand:- start:527 stop:745 length:219 start_codon:yes stop_codon:yes gene_type:complete
MMGSEAATIILGPLKSKMGGSNETEEVSEEEMEEYEYSDEQKEMAKELVKAVKGGDEEAVLMAMHGIVMSYD